MQSTSNSKFRINPLQLFLAMLFTITAMAIFNPITAHATTVEGNGSPGSGNEKDPTTLQALKGTDNGGAENGGTRKVSYLYWAGSISRQGYIMYFAKEIDGEPKALSLWDLTGKDSRAPFGVVIYSDDDMLDGVEYADTQIRAHLGTFNNVPTVPRPDMPLPVRESPNPDETWAGNTEALKKWLFTKTVHKDLGHSERWVALVYETLKEKVPGLVDEIVKKLSTDEDIVIVLETISSQALYDANKTWTQSDIQSGGYVLTHNVCTGEDRNGNPTYGDAYAFTQDPFAVSSDYYFVEGKCKPLLGTDRNGTRIVRKALTTAKYAAAYNESQTGTTEAGAKVWLYQALPYSMTLDEEQLGMAAANEKSTIISASQINDDKKGYGTYIINRIAPYINTYDIDTNPRDPKPSEKPSTDKGTDGRVNIIKVYADITIDETKGTKTVTHVGSFERPNCTDFIYLYDEEAITGYKLVDAIQQRSFIPGVRGDNFKDKMRATGLNFTTHNKPGDKAKMLYGYTYLYVYYTKTTIIKAPETTAYDFEIPESYITKQVYFSQAANTSNTEMTAQKFTQTNIEWVSSAFSACPGHEVFSCKKAIHTHSLITVKDPGKGKLKCGYKYEHTHGTNESNCKSK